MLAIGIPARLVFWSCFLIIVGNAVVNYWSAGDAGLAVAAVVLAPFTYFIYPFAADSAHQLWPFGDSVSLVVVLIVGAVAYPVSTIAGGLDPVE